MRQEDSQSLAEVHRLLKVKVPEGMALLNQNSFENHSRKAFLNLIESGLHLALAESARLSSIGCFSYAQLVLTQLLRLLEPNRFIYLPSLLTLALLHAGDFYLQVDNLKSAEECLSKAVAVSVDTKNEDTQILALTKLRDLYCDTSRFKKASVVCLKLNRMLSLNLDSNNKCRALVQSLLRTSFVYDKGGKPNMSKKYLHEAYDFARKSLSPNDELLHRLRMLLKSSDSPQPPQVIINLFSDVQMSKLNYNKMSNKCKQKFRQMIAIYGGHRKSYFSREHKLSCAKSESRNIEHPKLKLAHSPPRISSAKQEHAKPAKRPMRPHSSINYKQAERRGKLSVDIYSVKPQAYGQHQHQPVESQIEEEIKEKSAYSATFQSQMVPSNVLKIEQAVTKQMSLQEKQLAPQPKAGTALKISRKERDCKQLASYFKTLLTLLQYNKRKNSSEQKLVKQEKWAQPNKEVMAQLFFNRIMSHHLFKLTMRSKRDCQVVVTKGISPNLFTFLQKLKTMRGSYALNPDGVTFFHESCDLKSLIRLQRFAKRWKSSRMLSRKLKPWIKLSFCHLINFNQQQLVISGIKYHKEKKSVLYVQSSRPGRSRRVFFKKIVRLEQLTPSYCLGLLDSGQVSNLRPDTKRKAVSTVQTGAGQDWMPKMQNLKILRDEQHYQEGSLNVIELLLGKAGLGTLCVRSQSLSTEPLQLQLSRQQFQKLIPAQKLADQIEYSFMQRRLAMNSLQQPGYMIQLDQVPHMQIGHFYDYNRKYQTVQEDKPKQTGSQPKEVIKNKIQREESKKASFVPSTTESMNAYYKQIMQEVELEEKQSRQREIKDQQENNKALPMDPFSLITFLQELVIQSKIQPATQELTNKEQQIKVISKVKPTEQSKIQQQQEAQIQSCYQVVVQKVDHVFLHNKEPKQKQIPSQKINQRQFRGQEQEFKHGQVGSKQKHQTNDSIILNGLPLSLKEQLEQVKSQFQKEDIESLKKYKAHDLKQIKPFEQLESHPSPLQEQTVLSKEKETKQRLQKQTPQSIQKKQLKQSLNLLGFIQQKKQKQHQVNITQGSEMSSVPKNVSEEQASKAIQEQLDKQVQAENAAATKLQQVCKSKIYTRNQIIPLSPPLQLSMGRKHDSTLVRVTTLNPTAFKDIATLPFKYQDVLRNVREKQAEQLFRFDPQVDGYRLNRGAMEPTDFFVSQKEVDGKMITLLTDANKNSILKHKKVKIVICKQPTPQFQKQLWEKVRVVEKHGTTAILYDQPSQEQLEQVELLVRSRQSLIKLKLGLFKRDQQLHLELKDLEGSVKDRLQLGAVKPESMKGRLYLVGSTVVEVERRFRLGCSKEEAMALFRNRLLV